MSFKISRNGSGPYSLLFRGPSLSYSTHIGVLIMSFESRSRESVLPLASAFTNNHLHKLTERHRHRNKEAYMQMIKGNTLLYVNSTDNNEHMLITNAENFR